MDASRNEPQFFPVAQGFLALYHRPRRSVLEALVPFETLTVVTLMSEREGARSVGSMVETLGADWIWFPLENGDPLPNARQDEARHLLRQLRARLFEGRRVLLHCSAGIHRTGMIGYALLRSLGFNKEQALTQLHQLRELTAHGVRKHRLDWGNRLIDGVASSDDEDAHDHNADRVKKSRRNGSILSVSEPEEHPRGPTRRGRSQRRGHLASSMLEDDSDASIGDGSD